MRNDCPRPEQILLDDGLDRDHPQREHLETCDRCRTLLAARGVFLADPAAADADEETRLADADARLGAFIGGLTGGGRADGGAMGPAAGTGADGPRIVPMPPRGSGRSRTFAWPLGLAAVLVMVTGLWLMMPRQEIGNEAGTVPATQQPWRGAGPGGLPGQGPTVALHEDGWRLGWPAVDGADRYEVTVLAEDLAELLRLDAAGATEVLVLSSALPDERRAFFAVVTAFAADREVGHWPPARLP